MKNELKQLLTSARFEILELRRRNEILSAQLSVVEVFAAALGLKRQEQPQTIDVAWQLEREINKDGKE